VSDGATLALTHYYQPIQRLSERFSRILVLRAAAVATSATVGGVVAPIVVTATLGVIGFGVAGPIAGRFLYQVTGEAMRHLTPRNN
jgi:hypothetical protein